MNKQLILVVMLFLLLLPMGKISSQSEIAGKSAWTKYEKNPVLGGELGTCFDMAMLKEDGLYKMWFSWRPQKSIAYTESKDGVNWSKPVIVLSPAYNDWEKDLNRPGLVKRDGLYHMWYTGQAAGQSKIGYATSKDGFQWERKSEQPVLVAEEEWENVAVMCPHVEWDAGAKYYRMWYSGGEQYEPNAIGYATSKDGLAWKKHKANPIFFADKNVKWEQERATGGCVFKHGKWYYMFYIGFENVHLARIGVARSRDGITGWERFSANPIVSPDKDQWDASACYKPFVMYDAKEKKWRLWYNGRNAGFEQIGLVIHNGEDLGFPK
jgi:predicted GH43/DUF377 family glycosyl hydrolase